MDRRAARLLLCIASLTIAAGCGAAAPPPPATPVARIAPAEGAPPLPPSDEPLPPPPEKPEPPPQEGYDKEHPVPRCGPADSYRYIANHTCEDGSRPLGGDPGAGAQARSGNVGPNSTGHIIDLYVVECPEGPVEIFVDMYGCPE